MTDNLSTVTGEQTRRLTRGERREQILSAAIGVFAERGYAGATTDQIARAAGVSQPYVIRIFGSKHELFERVVDEVTAEIVDGFAAVSPGPDAKERMVGVYVRFVSDPDKLRVLLHTFALGSDPALGARAREILGTVFALYRERTGAGPDEARAFLADGMLTTVLFAVHAPEHVTTDARIAEVVGCFPALAQIISDPQGSDS